MGQRRRRAGQEDPVDRNANSIARPRTRYGHPSNNPSGSSPAVPTEWWEESTTCGSNIRSAGRLRAAHPARIGDIRDCLQSTGGRDTRWEYRTGRQFQCSFLQLCVARSQPTNLGLERGLYALVLRHLPGARRCTCTDTRPHDAQLATRVQLRISNRTVRLNVLFLGITDPTGVSSPMVTRPGNQMLQQNPLQRSAGIQ